MQCSGATRAPTHLCTLLQNSLCKLLDGAQLLVLELDQLPQTIHLQGQLIILEAIRVGGTACQSVCWRLVASVVWLWCCVYLALVLGQQLLSITLKVAHYLCQATLQRLHLCRQVADFTRFAMATLGVLLLLLSIQVHLQQRKEQGTHIHTHSVMNLCLDRVVHAFHDEHTSRFSLRFWSSMASLECCNSSVVFNWNLSSSPCSTGGA